MKRSKKILAMLLSVILLCCLPLSAMAEANVQPQAASADDHAIVNPGDLKSGELYRIRNAGSGKYLTGNSNVYQSAYDPNNDSQKFEYIETDTGCEFRSPLGKIGAEVKLYTYNVITGGKTGWSMNPAGDGVRILSKGMKAILPEYNYEYYMTALGDAEGSNSGIGRVDGNVVLENYIYSDYKYQIWYFEKVVEDNVVKNAGDLQNGKYYRIRNAGSGKYLEFGNLNVFQNDYNENGNQIVRYVDNGATCEFVSYWYGNLGGTYELYNFNVVPGCRTANGTPVRFGWNVFNARTDGAMQISCVGMQSLSSMTFMTAVGNENGSNMGSGRSSDGNIIFDSFSWSGNEYQLWYFEEVK